MNSLLGFDMGLGNMDEAADHVNDFLAFMFPQHEVQKGWTARHLWGPGANQTIDAISVFSETLQKERKKQITDPRTGSHLFYN